MAKRGAAVLEMPGPEYALENGSRARGGVGRTRRDPVEDFADEYDKVLEPERRRKTTVKGPAIKVKLGSRVRLPSTTAGMIATGVALLVLLGAVFWLLAVTRSFLLHDARFQIASASAIEIEGNHHLKRGQLLNLFSEDLERNIFGVSLEQRQADLEALPWVQRATVMRLLPGRLRVSLVERTPVAFVRQGGRIGLVDAQGVLLDMATGPQAEHYSFPVVTGIAASDPASTRAARMRIFARFTTDLDVGGAKNTESLSEVDLSNPEDVKALVEEHGATVMVHFGEDQFLERFNKVKELLPQWHAQYPKLASADMRYEHEIPLAMVSAAKAPPLPVAPKPVSAPAAHGVVAAHAAAPTPKPVVHTSGMKKPVAVTPAAREFVPAPAVKPWEPAGASKPQPLSGAASVSATARSGFTAKTAGGPTPKPVAVAMPKAPAKASSKPSVSVAPKPVAPQTVPSGAAARHSGAKPAAGKPLAVNDLNPSTQAAQR